jgi:hypothetical protein
MYAVTAWDVLYDPLAVLIDAFKLVEAWGLTSSQLVMGCELELDVRTSHSCPASVIK